MGLVEVIARVRPGVFHIVALNAQNERIANGTGFVSRGYLITNNHVYAGCLSAQRVWVRQEGDALPNGGKIINAQELPRRLKTGSAEQSYDYAVLDLPEVVTGAGWSFVLRKPDGGHIGDPIALLGFPLEHDNLSCSEGVISSFYQSGMAQIIQIDASVNSGNSGGPLLDHHTGHVLGIVTRKATGLTKMFAQLKTAVRGNLQMLQNAGGGISVGGVDPVMAAKVSQTQMLHVLDEIERQTNVGIGYAVSVEHIMQEPCLIERNTPKK